MRSIIGQTSSASLMICCTVKRSLTFYPLAQEVIKTLNENLLFLGTRATEVGQVSKFALNTWKYCAIKLAFSMSSRADFKYSSEEFIVQTKHRRTFR